MLSMVQGTAVGQTAEGAIEGYQITKSPWGALIGAILGVLSSLEHWQDLLDEIDVVIEPLKPALEAIINLLISRKAVTQ